MGAKQLMTDEHGNGIGQKSCGIGIGDGSVVTNMAKRGRKPGKKKELTFTYIPSGRVYTPQQLEEFRVKEEQLIQYVMEQLLIPKAPSN